jgi:ribosomal protein S20
LNGFEKLMRTRAGVALCFGLTVGLGGCRHKAQVAMLPAVLTPVALEDIPAPEDLPMVEVQPAKLPPVPVVANEGKPKRERKKPAPKAAPPPEPVQMAAAVPPPSPEDTAIGALTAGGEANPQTKQEAADLITGSEKRLNALPAQKAEEEKAQVSKVKNFLKDAQEALKTGDAEGAKTLATKAKLLLDDLEKR